MEKRRVGILVMATLLSSGLTIPEVGAATLQDEDRATQSACEVMYASFLDPTSLQITWETDSTTTEAVAEIETVVVGSAGEPTRRTVFGESMRRQAADGGAYYRHNAEFRGLTPATEYKYRCKDGQRWGEWTRFKTASRDAAFPPSSIPDRVVLTWSSDPATSMAVSWRTDTSVTRAVAEIAEATASPERRPADPMNPYVHPNAARVDGSTAAFADTLYTSQTAKYHSVEFTGLEPNTLYAYRVGDGDSWSEWFHFRTATDTAGPFSFLYFGDIQNGIRSLVSRVQRHAFLNHPDVRFNVYAGDLVGVPDDVRWGEWFHAGGWAHATIPSVPSPGNHEYEYDVATDDFVGLTNYWRRLFVLPEHGPEGLEETVYYVDYQGVRIISLNSTALLYFPNTRAKQLEWLEHVLRDNANRWTCIVLHHPVWGREPLSEDSEGNGTPEAFLAKSLKPLFDRYRVDLVMQGHFHYYARGRHLRLNSWRGFGEEDLGEPEGGAGTVYVTSASSAAVGRSEGESEWMDRVGDELQLYQVVRIAQDTLSMETYTATGQLYDAFDLIKQRGGGPKKLINRIPPDDRF